MLFYTMNTKYFFIRIIYIFKIKKNYNHQKPPVPWKSVWTSAPVWAIIVAHTCSNWGWYMLLVKLPTYMRYILKFDIKSVSTYSISK